MEKTIRVTVTDRGILIPVDTSALVKRYIDEPGSDWIRTTLSQFPPPSVILVNLAIVEMTSALARWTWGSTDE